MNLPFVCRRFSSWLAAMILSGAGTATVSGFDFRLHSTTVLEDGLAHERSYFQDGDQGRVMITLPPDWTVAADPGTLTLTSPAFAGSMIRLANSGLTPDVPLQDKTLDTFRKNALTLLPDGATNVRLAEEHRDPLPIFHWKDHEFVVEYEFFGETYRRSVLFVNVNAREQIVVTTLAPKSAYDRVRAIAFDVLQSWQGVRSD